MNLGQLCIWTTGLVPEADENLLPSISTTQLCKRDILNQACTEFVGITKCLPKDVRVNVSGGIQSYSISSMISDFSDFREEGVWHFRSSTQWWRVQPKTIRELDQEVPFWRIQSATDLVRYYWRDGDILGFYYTPSTSVSKGLWLYYYAQPKNMSNLTDYPFTGTSTEDVRLANYDNILLDYYKSKALGILGYKDDENKIITEFYNKCNSARGVLQSRRDLAQSSKSRVKTNMMSNQFRRNK
jgi:hypothetical protein